MGQTRPAIMQTLRKGDVGMASLVGFLRCSLCGTMRTSSRVVSAGAVGKHNGEWVRKDAKKLVPVVLYSC